MQVYCLKAFFQTNMLLLLPATAVLSTAILSSPVYASPTPASDKIMNSDLAPSGSNVHYSYGTVYEHHRDPYGKEAGYAIKYGEEVDQGYKGYNHKGYTDHLSYGKLCALEMSNSMPDFCSLFLIKCNTSLNHVTLQQDSSS